MPRQAEVEDGKEAGRLSVASGMVTVLLGLAAQAALASAPVPSNVEGPLNPNAHALFERDPQLKAWALRLFDGNGDGWLTLYEAQPALAAFKEIADADRDGRVTTYEYARAKEFIIARWAVR